MGWFGNWLGAGGSSSGSGGVVITDNVTTAELIRDHMIALIAVTTPTLLSGDRFRPYRDEGDGKFVPYAGSVGAGAWRMYQVLDTGEDRPPDTTNTLVQGCFVKFELRVAYPQTSRAGAANARDRNDVMRADQYLLEQTVGLNGYANFTGASNPNAAWIEGETFREAIDGIDYLVIRQTMRFWRRMVPA